MHELPDNAADGAAAAKMDLDDFIPIVLRHFGSDDVAEDAGIIHEDVKSAICIDRSTTCNWTMPAHRWTRRRHRRQPERPEGGAIQLSGARGSRLQSEMRH